MTWLFQLRVTHSRTHSQTHAHTEHNDRACARALLTQIIATVTSRWWKRRYVNEQAQVFMCSLLCNQGGEAFKKKSVTLISSFFSLTTVRNWGPLEKIDRRCTALREPDSLTSLNVQDWGTRRAAHRGPKEFLIIEAARLFGGELRLHTFQSHCECTKKVNAEAALNQSPVSCALLKPCFHQRANYMQLCCRHKHIYIIIYIILTCF